MDFYRHLFIKNEIASPITFVLVYFISVLFTFQMLLTAYSSSTYMEQFVEPGMVGILFAIGAFIAIILSLTLPRLLRKIGNVKTILFLSALISLSLLFLGLALSPLMAILSFIVYLAVIPQVFLNIDIFLETLIGTDEGSTGSRRGLILTLMSIAAFFSPLAMGYIIGEDNQLSNVYFVGAGVGVLFISIIIVRFRHFYDPFYKIVRVRDMLRDASKNINVRTVMATQFLLQFFFAWAVIYIPLFMAREIGLDWPTISKIIAAGLFAFIILEYPIGVLADKRYGEKEMMALGFVVLAIASASISFMANASIISWMVLMFFSRIGASLVEVTTESYFFKQVNGDEPNLIGLFRLMRPLATLIGALVGSIYLFFNLPFNLIFIVLALVMATGVFITSRLIDTR